MIKEIWLENPMCDMGSSIQLECSFDMGKLIYIVEAQEWYDVKYWKDVTDEYIGTDGKFLDTPLAQALKEELGL